MPNDLLSLQLDNLDASQKSTVTFLSGVSSSGTIVTSGAYFIDQKFAPTTWQTGLGKGASGITFAFDPTVSDVLFSAQMKSYTAQALAIWSDIANIKFTYSTDFANADVKVVLAATGQGTAASATDTKATTTPLLTQTTKETISINLDTGRPFGSPDSYTAQSGFGIYTLVHEVGHLLGLGHAGQYNQVGTTAVDYGPSQRNNSDVWTWSAMSYIDPLNPTAVFASKYSVAGTSWLTPGETPAATGQGQRAPFTPMALDMFAAQRLYGASANGNLAGGQVFGFNSNVMFTDIDGTRRKLSMYDFSQDVAPVVTLYDSGDNNTLDLSQFKLASTVNLTPGSWTSTSGMTNNIFIQWGTRIDTAIGGDGDDTFTLNANGDRVDGGKGQDTVILSGARSAYLLGLGGGAITLTEKASGKVNHLSDVETVVFAGTAVAVSKLSAVTWTGAVNDLYTEDGNWDLGQAPDGPMNVVITGKTTARIDNPHADLMADSLTLGADATLDIDAGRFTIVNAHQQSTLDGTLAINAVGSEVSVLLSGTMANNGSLFLFGPGAELVTNDHSVKIGGTGTISMVQGNIGGRTFADATPLDVLVSTNLVHGSGTIGHAGFLNGITFVNQGSVVADGVTALTLAGSVVNKGLIAGASSLGVLALDSGIDNSAGRIVAQDKGTVDLEGGFIAGGTIAAEGSGLLEVSGSATLDGRDSPVTLNGGIVVDAGRRLTLRGRIIGGTIDATAGTVGISGASLDGVTLLGGLGHVQFVAPGPTLVATPTGLTAANGRTIAAGTGLTLSYNFVTGDNGYNITQGTTLDGGTIGASMGINAMVSMFGGGTIAMNGTGDVIAGVGAAVVGDQWVLGQNSVVGSGLIIGTRMEIDVLAGSSIVARGGSLTVDPGSRSLRSDGFLGADAGATLVLMGTVDLLDTALFGIPHTPTFGGAGTIALGGADVLRSAVGVLRGGTIQAGVNFAIGAPGGRFVDRVRNDSTVAVRPGATLAIADTFINAGAVVLGEFGAPQGATFAAFNHATLMGGGTIVLRNAQDIVTAALPTDALTNFDNTIRGTGRVGPLQNAGSIIADSIGRALVVDSGTRAIENIGLMAATNGGTLELDGFVGNQVDHFPEFFGRGTVAARGAGSVVLLNNGTLHDGQLVSQDGGAFVIGGNYTLLSDPLAVGTGVTSDATIRIGAGRTLTLVESLANNGLIALNGTVDAGTGINTGAVLQLRGTVSLGGTGTVALSNPADTISLRGIDELDNDGNTIRGIGHIGIGDFQFVNHGTVQATNGLLTLNTGNKVATNGNVLGATGGGTLAIAGATLNSGVITAEGGTVVVQGALSGNGHVRISNGAVALGGPVGTGQAIEFDFANHNALLTINNVATMKGNVFGMVAGDTIDVRGVVADSFIYSSGHLNLQAAGTTVAVLNMPVGPQGTVALASDKAGGTYVFVKDPTLRTPTLRLAAGSDSGASSLDQVTNLAAPTFTGTATANAQITLLDGTIAVGTTTANVIGGWSVSPAAPLGQGVHAIKARAGGTNGAPDLTSAALTVTIDTIAPSASAPALASGSDTGASDTDRITASVIPVVAGTAEAGAVVTLFDGAVTLGTSNADGAGLWSIQTPALVPGLHVLATRVTDLAGNVSAASGPLAVKIDPVAPDASSMPDLAPGSDTGVSASDDVTNRTTLVLTGHAEAAAKVTLFDGGVAAGSAVASVAGAWSIQVAGLAAGGHSFAAQVVDAAGNASGMSTALAVTIDTTAPPAASIPDLLAASDLGMSDSDNLTSETTPVFVGSAEPGAQVSLFDGATALGSAIADASGAWSIQASPLAGGVHAITARIADAAGNAGPASKSLSVTIDTTTPATPGVPDLSSPSDAGISALDNLTDVTTPVFTGKADPGAIVTLFDGATAIGSGKASSLGNWSVTAAALADGVHAITAQAMDAAGNASGASEALSVTIDTAAPAAPGTPDLVSATDTGLSALDNVTAVAAPAFTGKAALGTTVTLFDGAVAIGSAKTTSLGNWSIKASALTDGVHAITARATDAAGNTGLASAALSVRIDTTAPAAPTTPDLASASDSGGTALDNVTNVATPIFTGKAEVGSTVTLFDGATAIGSAKTTSLGNWSIKAAALADGVHAITAVATDAAGNASVASAALAVTLDTAAPAAPSAPDLSSASDSGTSALDNLTKVATPLFTGKAEVGAIVTLFDGVTAIGSAKTTSLGSWSIKASVLADGAHAITARATDAAGNASVASAALSVTIDTAAPAAPTTPDLQSASDSGISALDNVTKVATPVFTGKAEVGTTVTLFDGVTAIGSAKTTSLGNWSIKAAALADGVHAITAMATDAAGNAGLASAALSVTVDTAAPAAPTVPDLQSASDSGASALDNITKAATPTFTGKAEIGSTVTLFDGVTAIGSAKTTSLGNWSIKASVLVDGAHAITAQATDAAGNPGLASAALAVTVDTAAPAAPSAPDLAAASDTGSSSTDNVTDVTTPSFSGKGEPGAAVTLFDGATAVGASKVSATGSWSAKASSLGLGSHVMTAVLTDAAGNASAPSAALAVTVMAPPALSADEAAMLVRIDSGGTILLDPALSGATILLGAATHLVLNKLQFITAVGSDGDDTISAQGPRQTLTGGSGHDVLEGFAGHGTTFRDTAAGFDVDRLCNFGGDDVIAVPDLLPWATLAYEGSAMGGTLALTDGLHSARIGLDGGYAASDFRLVSDGQQGIQVLFRPG